MVRGVALCSQAKGRSASEAIHTEMMQNLGVLLAGVLFPSGLFIPTRLKPADGPTRHRGAPERERPPLSWLTRPAALQWALAGPPVARWLGSWLRLVLALVGAAFLASLPAPGRPCPRDAGLRGALLASGPR